MSLFQLVGAKDRFESPQRCVQLHDDGTKLGRRDLGGLVQGLDAGDIEDFLKRAYIEVFHCEEEGKEREGGGEKQREREREREREAVTYRLKDACTYVQICDICE